MIHRRECGFVLSIVYLFLLYSYYQISSVYVCVFVCKFACAFFLQIGASPLHYATTNE